MIVHKHWIHVKQTRYGFVLRTWHREGWFLFGLVPLYVRDVTTRGPNKPPK